MWSDLSVVYEDLDCKDNHARRCHLLATAHDLGYDALAWNVTVHGRIPKPFAAPKLVELAAEPTKTSSETEPVITPGGRQAFRLLSGSGWSMPVGHTKTRAKVATQDCKQYTRLTLVMDESSNAHELNSTNNVIQQFDIIAVRPMTERFFLAACATLEVDIISIDLQERLPFKLKFQTIGQALQRGIHFEITLAQPLRGQGGRKHWLSNALDLLRATKGRNIIFTSDALYPIHMRAPHDLVNLAALLGLTSAEGRAAMTQHTNSVLLHGETRKLQKAVLAAAPASTAAAWQLPAQPAGSGKPVKGAKRKRSTSGQDAEATTPTSTQSSSDNP